MDAELAVTRLRALLRVATVSRIDSELQDSDAFRRFPVELERLYPAAYRALELERVAGTGLLFRWRGAERGDAAVLMAHWDVVPADEPGWRHPPFAAETSTDPDGERRIWGRGAIDDKGALVAILEAVEALLESGFAPRRDVYLSFGGDEEVHGEAAAAIAALLTSRGVRASLVLDEGGAIVTGKFPGIPDPAAVIGIAEKGVATVELIAREPGGHAAHPPRSGRTATTRLARAILRVSRPAPAALSGPVLAMLAVLGHRARGPIGVAYRHPALFRPVLLRALARTSDEGSALLRTTRVVTRLRGAAADNVLPETARATVNLRIAVGSTLAAEIDRIRRDVADPGIGIELVRGSESPPASPVDGPAWDRVVAALAVSHPGTLAVPYGMLGATDGRHFTRICDAVYRFTPFELSDAELGGLHAIDESIRVNAFLRGIDFYRVLLSGL